VNAPRVPRPSCSRGGNSNRGFTLIELAVVVFVVTLILGGILVPLSSQVEQRQVAEAERQLEQIKEALLGYAVVNGHLPCPDKTAAIGLTVNLPNDGQEDFDNNTGLCDPNPSPSTGAEGNIAWATLGIPATDPWGNRYRYRVSATFAQHPPAALFDLAKQGTLRLCTSNTCSAVLSVSPPSTNSPVVVVLSHGPNGLGAMNRDTNAFQPAPTSLDELANVNADDMFVSRPPSSGEFDDIVVWLSPHTLKNRMVAAGKLP
jgi:prepilin-type N-terminal cleavage/methylation domain-containing protein